MKAQHLANLLLEMNILNTKDVTRELDRISARVYDKRGKEWLQRVGKYFLLNIDELMTREAKLRPEAHPRNPWYYDPKEGWIETERMRKPGEPQTTPASPDEQWVFRANGERNLFLEIDDENIDWSRIGEATVFPQPDFGKFKARAKGWDGTWVRTIDLDLKRPGDVRKEQVATRYGLESIAKPGHYYWRVGREATDPEIGQPVTTNKSAAWASADPEEVKDMQMYIGAKKFKRVKLENFKEKRVEDNSRSQRMLNFILEVRDKNRPPYTTMLHAQPEWSEDPGGKHKKQPPFWQRARDQTYTPFNPKKAKAKTLPGEGPAKGDVQPWMFDTEGKPKDLQFFNQWDMSQQEVWQVLSDIADWFNFLYSEIRSGSRTDELVYQSTDNTSKYLSDTGEWGSILNALHYESDDIKDADVPPGGKWVNPATHRAAEANAYLDRLKSHKRDDVDAFRDVVMDTVEFKHDVRTSPTRFMRDVKTVGHSGPFTIRRTTTFDATCKVQDRPGFDSEAIPRWCVHTSSHYPTYAGTPLYFVEKDGKPFVLVHWPTGQVKNELNNSASDAILDAIAPAFAANTREFTDQMMQDAASKSGHWGAGEGQRLAQRILAIRGR